MECVVARDSRLVRFGFKHLPENRKTPELTRSISVELHAHEDRLPCVLEILR